jgi:hypothetical protein
LKIRGVTLILGVTRGVTGVTLNVTGNVTAQSPENTTLFTDVTSVTSFIYKVVKREDLGTRDDAYRA